VAAAPHAGGNRRRLRPGRAGVPTCPRAVGRIDFANRPGPRGRLGTPLLRGRREGAARLRLGRSPAARHRRLRR
jgi:hypothetical protein